MGAGKYLEKGMAELLLASVFAAGLASGKADAQQPQAAHMYSRVGQSSAGQSALAPNWVNTSYFPGVFNPVLVRNYLGNSSYQISVGYFNGGTAIGFYASSGFVPLFGLGYIPLLNSWGYNLAMPRVGANYGSVSGGIFWTPQPRIRKAELTEESTEGVIEHYLEDLGEAAGRKVFRRNEYIEGIGRVDFLVPKSGEDEKMPNQFYVVDVLKKEREELKGAFPKTVIDAKKRQEYFSKRKIGYRALLVSDLKKHPDRLKQQIEEITAELKPLIFDIDTMEPHEYKWVVDPNTKGAVPARKN